MENPWSGHAKAHYIQNEIGGPKGGSTDCNQNQPKIYSLGRRSFLFEGGFDISNDDECEWLTAIEESDSDSKHHAKVEMDDRNPDILKSKIEIFDKNGKLIKKIKDMTLEERRIYNAEKKRISTAKLLAMPDGRKKLNERQRPHSKRYYDKLMADPEKRSQRSVRSAEIQRERKAPYRPTYRTPLEYDDPVI